MQEASMTAIAQTDSAAPRLPLTDDARYAAIARRDAAMDGRFVYSVATTGVYCRPCCAARMPRRENVAFHATCAAAEAAGFRACKRCRPNEPPLAARHAAAMEAACRALDRAVAEGEDLPPLAALAGASGLSSFHFHRLFRRIVGVTPKAYAGARRMARIQAGLAGPDSVTEAIYDAGYSSSSRFYERAPSMLGMTPTQYREGGRDAVIRFALGRCSLGDVLVAATDKGVCAIQLGDTPEALLAELERRFPRATLIGADAAFERLVAQVVGAVENPGTGLDLALDLRGTAFQLRVWEALRAIPAGQTDTYTGIAARIGRPRSVRAVAAACAANPAAIAIPCHRVVRIGGGLAGYRWGIERKRTLLEREHALPAGQKAA
jgi:AraC family transcriptional regulator, regulatory protein of adaptative response / methylated-DNA-[protein]-cysteine methyltransferase